MTLLRALLELIAALLILVFMLPYGATLFAELWRLVF